MLLDYARYLYKAAGINGLAQIAKELGGHPLRRGRRAAQQIGVLGA